LRSAHFIRPQHPDQHRRGLWRSHPQGVARFLDISIKSANETEYHLLASRDLQLISRVDWQEYTTETLEVRKMIYAYRVAILRDDGGPAHKTTDRTADR
jgi:four helix bundle protein